MRSSSIIVLAVSLAFLGSCVSRTQYMAQVNAARGLTDTLDKLRPYLDQLEGENTDLRAENARHKKTAQDAAWVAQQRQKLERLLGELEQQGGLGSMKGVGIVQDLEGRVGLRIDDQVLFASGRAEISENGRATLVRLMPFLRKDGRQVRIDGHTDADPIQKSKWKSNLHLSGYRALAVAEALHAIGIPYDKLLIAGFGPTRPVSRAAGDKARNRRVELYLQ